VAMSARCPVCPKADTTGRFMSTRPGLTPLADLGRSARKAPLHRVRAAGIGAGGDDAEIGARLLERAHRCGPRADGGRGALAASGCPFRCYRIRCNRWRIRTNKRRQLPILKLRSPMPRGRNVDARSAGPGYFSIVTELRFSRLMRTFMSPAGLATIL